MPETPRYSHTEGIRLGRKQAISVLIKNAEDFEQMAAQQQQEFEARAKERWFQAVKNRTQAIEYASKARLLRGQAKLIEELP
jgi:hypothetical protein